MDADVHLGNPSIHAVHINSMYLYKCSRLDAIVVVIVVVGRTHLVGIRTASRVRRHGSFRARGAEMGCTQVGNHRLAPCRHVLVRRGWCRRSCRRSKAELWAIPRLLENRVVGVSSNQKGEPGVALSARQVIGTTPVPCTQPSSRGAWRCMEVIARVLLRPGTDGTQEQDHPQGPASFTRRALGCI